MARKYSEKASHKVERTMREFKHGTLKSGSGGKVTSRKQAIAIGLSQARRAGYKVPKQSHATMSLDARVRAYLSSMRPGQEIDARGIARAIGVVDPLEADYALERAAKAGHAVTSDGRWFGPAGRTSHAKKKSSAQLDADIVRSVGKRIDRKKLGEMMGPWGGDFAYGRDVGSIGAVSSYYYSDKKYPDRVIVETALAGIEDTVPRAMRGEAGWTRADAKELRRIAQGLRYYLVHDYA